MSLASVEKGLKHYIKSEGPVTVDTTDYAELAQTLGPDAGFMPGAEPMIGILVAEALYDLQRDGVIEVNTDHKEGTTELHYAATEPSSNEGTHTLIRSEDLFSHEELIQMDNEAVLSIFESLTTQEELSKEQEIILANALIHAIEKVQKNLDNLI